MAGLFSQGKRDLDRIAKIMDIMVKFEVGNFVERWRTGERLPIHISRSKEKEIHYTTSQERVRMMFEELGTTFVKLGQLLSTRGDIIGPEYAVELSKLQDNVKPFPTDIAKKIIVAELDRPISHVFKSFDAEPFASASIAQVYRATLKNGKNVVVKVQRPEIDVTIKEDLRIMHYLAKMAEKYVPESRKYDPEYLVDEFERSILKELNFLRESRNALRLKENFKEEKWIYVPTVYENLSTRRVLIMEEVRGTPLSQVVQSKSDKFDKKLIARRCLAAFFKMVLEDGFYHADLHPGNIMVLNNNTICFLDYGRVGTIDKDVAEDIFRLASFALNNDASGLVEHLIRTNMLSDSADTESLKADISDLLDGYYSNRVEDVELGHLLSDLVDLISKYEFNRPRELAELTRSILILEGIGLELDQNFSIAQEFKPYSKKIETTRMDAQTFSSIIKDGLVEFEYMVRYLPMTMRRVLRHVGEGRLKIELEHKDLSTFVKNIEGVGNRLSIALILAAIIIGSSAIVQADKQLGIIIFTISVILGAGLILRIILYSPD